MPKGYRLSAEQVNAVKELLAAGVTQPLIAAKLGASETTISRISRGLLVGPNTPTYKKSAAAAVKAAEYVIPETPPKVLEPDTTGMGEVRKALLKGPRSVMELADILDTAPRRVEVLLTELRAKGALLFEKDGRWDLHHAIHIEPQSVVTQVRPGIRKIGVVGDNHLCNKHARLDVLNTAYDRFLEEGITDVYNTGNYVDGEARFNKTELIVRPGLQSQIDYAIDNYPQRKGITTHFIDGDDHEGWYYQRERIQFGKLFESDAKDQGRSDLHYLGYGECDVKLTVPGGGFACMRIVHPGGGSAYATSYALQKLVESYQGGEKPRILLAGHYHKFDFGYPREIYVLQTACTCDQTMFLRKNKIAVHVGFNIVTIGQDDTGDVTKFAVDWNPFYDRGKYEKRFGG